MQDCMTSRALYNVKRASVSAVSIIGVYHSPENSATNTQTRAWGRMACVQTETPEPLKVP